MKRLLFRLLGKDPEAVVVSFCSGPPDLAARMVAEVRRLVPDREHFAVTREPLEGVTSIAPEQARSALRRKRIGLAPTLFFTGPEYNSIRRLAFSLAPFRILAWNRALERHHLKLTTPIASLLFLRGVSLDRIWLRPRWFPFRRERSEWPQTHLVVDGRQPVEGRARVAVFTPYFPWPLSHGGAVRIFNLLREASEEFDIFLFTFALFGSTDEGRRIAQESPLTEFCSKLILFPNPRYREPRWASLRPPEVNEFTSGYVARTVAEYRRRYDLRVLQLEYTQLGAYNGDILVEHDVTFDLYDQLHKREQSLSSWWNLWRWRRFERAALRRFPRVVVMSGRDAQLANTSSVVIPNGVDLQRFQPAPQAKGPELLFVGSFAHFPNVLALRWFLDQVLPLLPSDVRLTVISGRNPELYWTDPIPADRVTLHGFIADVRPFYEQASVVVVPTIVSAGTNLKVLEAMAAERAVVSTTSGVNGLSVGHREHVLIADTPDDFAGAVSFLLQNESSRETLAKAARRFVEENYGWKRIGLAQRRLWRDLLIAKSGIRIRKGTRDDLSVIQEIQLASHGASQWEPDTYFVFDVRVAERSGSIAGFLVSRLIAPDEVEVLNIAVHPAHRKRGVASAMLQSVAETQVFLEVRESNIIARSLYTKLGFEVVGRRENYYDDPVEAALVMRRR